MVEPGAGAEAGPLHWLRLRNNVSHSTVTSLTKPSHLRTQPTEVFRIRIQMDQGFFADPDPNFKSPEPSVFCFNYLL